MAIKVPKSDIDSAHGNVPIRVRHELLTHPAAPVIRMVVTIYDRARHPLALETFINVEDTDQREYYQALADQDTLLMLFYDETVTYRLTKGVENPFKDQIKQIVSKADELFAAIPKETFDFDKAKADVIERRSMYDSTSAPIPDREPQPLRDRDLRRLHPDITQRLLPLAERLTGTRPIIKRADTLPNDTHGLLKPPETPNKPWELIYLRGQERFMEHIIANQIGKIVRLYQVPPEERLQPAITPQTREHVMNQLMPELFELLAIVSTRRTWLGYWP